VPFVGPALDLCECYRPTSLITRWPEWLLLVDGHVDLSLPMTIIEGELGTELVKIHGLPVYVVEL